MRHLLFLVVVLSFPLTTSARDVHIRVLAAPTAAECLRSASIIGRTTEGLVRVPLRDGVTEYDLALAGDEAWDVTVDAQRCWSETITISPTEHEPVIVRVHRAGTAEGTLESEGAPPTELKATVYPGENTTDWNGGFPVSCHIQQSRWRCTVPADVPFDLRLETPGFATIYYWSVRADHEQPLELKPQRLYAGASVAGWVQSEDRVPVPATVTLYPIEATTVQSGADARRLATRGYATKTTPRGFFQFAGLGAGTYRLVSEAKGYSSARVHEVTLREGESLRWPRAIVHMPPAALDLSLYPPSDHDGKPWVVELAEETPLHLEREPPLRRSATTDGQWAAHALRADVYHLTVSDRHGSKLESIDVDLSEGGTKSISVTVRSILVQGTLTLAGEPLDADVKFSNFSGKIVRTTTGEEGSFRAMFPMGGNWTPTVRYPRENGSDITLNPVTIDPTSDSNLDIQIPGGRIRGVVLGPDQTPEQAAVTVLQGHKQVATVLAPATGKFDIIGIPPGEYSIEAEGPQNATARPVTLSLQEDELEEIQLLLARQRRIYGTVITPTGVPAGGAVVHVVDDAAWSWRRVVADVEGRFEYRVPAGSGNVVVIAIAYGYPSAIARTDGHGALTVTLRPDGGILRVRNAPVPYVRTPTAAVPLRAFLFPEPSGRFNGGAYLEAGTYLVCPNGASGTNCRSVTIAPGADTTVDFAENTGERTQ